MASGCADVCSIGGAPVDGLVAAAADHATAMTFGGLRGRADGTCELAVMGDQVGGTGGGWLSLCVHGDGDIGTDIEVLSLAGVANNCELALDRSAPVAGVGHTEGHCDGHPGFALVLDATATMTRTCATGIDTLAVTLRGRVAVQ